MTSVIGRKSAARYPRWVILTERSDQACGRSIYSRRTCRSWRAMSALGHCAEAEFICADVRDVSKQHLMPSRE
jgi:hypothetical protein